MDASEETANEIYAQASEMASAADLSGFEAMATRKHCPYNSNYSGGRRTVSGVGEARNLVFWAYR